MATTTQDTSSLRPIADVAIAGRASHLESLGSDFCNEHGRVAAGSFHSTKEHGLFRIEIPINVNPDHPGVLPHPGNQGYTQRPGQQDELPQRPAGKEQVLDPRQERDQGNRERIAHVHRPREITWLAPAEPKAADGAVLVHQPQTAEDGSRSALGAAPSQHRADVEAKARRSIRIALHRDGIRAEHFTGPG